MTSVRESGGAGHDLGAITVEDAVGRLRSMGLVGPLDAAVATRLCGLASESRAAMGALIALTSAALAEGHVCLPLSEVTSASSPATRVPDTVGDRDDAFTGLDAGRRGAGVHWLELVVNALDGYDAQSLAAMLADSPLSGDGQAVGPVVVDRGRCYLRRMYEHEVAVANHVLHLASSEQRGGSTDCHDAATLAALNRLFPIGHVPGAGQLSLVPVVEPDLQRVAAEVATRQKLTVISGGPGTGKTSTVVKILAVVVEQAFGRGLPAPRVLLLAPTGKAAARMAEAIGAARAHLDCDERVRAEIPCESTTLHRALGARPGRAGFARDRHRPLVADVVLVDESSMVDLSLMRALFEALPRDARLILLGDQDQLASVEAGAVLGDLCGVGVPRQIRSQQPLGRTVVHLTRSYRFGPNSGIGALAAAIRRGDVRAALETLEDEARPDVQRMPVLPMGGLGHAVPIIVGGYRPYLKQLDPALALEHLSGFRLLCAHRSGRYGVERMNAQIEALLKHRRLLGAYGGEVSQPPGRPLMVLRNDHAARVYNGDVGLVTRQGEDIRVALPSADGSVRLLPPSRLPRTEPVYAMTVHKSQGSEFGHVAVVLPAEPSALLTRELLYTAVTRAKHRVTIFGSPGVIRSAIETPTRRLSGLRSRLWGA